VIVMGLTNRMELGKIERRRAVDDVHQAIRDAILDRRFPAGMRLNAEELASQLGVSLTPIRSAIQLLSAEGLVDVHSRSGTFVATLSRRDLEETFEIRGALECLAAESAASLTDGDIDKVRKLLAVLSKPIGNDSQRQVHEQANSEFHDTIIRSAGNRRLADMYESLQAHIAMCRVHRHDGNWELRLPKEQQEHEEIVQAMERRDSKALVKALRSHISRAKNVLMQNLPSA
jgi:DNA-binding GntR family transcriptional regulator